MTSNCLDRILRQTEKFADSDPLNGSVRQDAQPHRTGAIKKGIGDFSPTSKTDDSRRGESRLCDFGAPKALLATTEDAKTA